METSGDTTRINTVISYIDSIYESFYISNCLVLVDDNTTFKSELETILKDKLYPIEYGKLHIQEYSFFVKSLKENKKSIYDTIIVDRTIIDREGFSICSAFARQDSLNENLVIVVL